MQLGTLAVLAWIVSPYLPTFVKPPKAADKAPKEAPSSTPKTGSQRRKAKKEEAASPAPPTAPETPPSKPEPPTKASQLFRVALLPLLPLLISTVLGPPTLPQPLLEPYVHPRYPLRILSSVPSRFSSVVVVGEALPPSPNDAVQDRPHSLRYLRAGHSLLGGVYIGDHAYHIKGTQQAIFDEAGTVLGDSIYSTFVLQEAAQLIDRTETESKQKKALFM